MPLRPELLQHPTIPKALHGISPRNIMGVIKWDDVRYETIHKQGDKCLACGSNEFMECHESYSINYTTGEVKFVELVGLCSKCHKFIHSGLLKVLYKTGRITKEYYEKAMTHGLIVLANAELEPHVITFIDWLYHTENLSDTKIEKQISPNQYKQLKEIKNTKVKWQDWHLLFEGKKYYSKFKNYKEWELFYRRKR